MEVGVRLRKGSGFELGSGSGSGQGPLVDRDHIHFSGHGTHVPEPVPDVFVMFPQPLQTDCLSPERCR